MNKRWIKKYQPSHVDQYIFPTGKAGKDLHKALTQKHPPHLILHGLPGLGKTSFVPVFANKFAIANIDVNRYMGSDIACSSDIKQLIYPFITTLPLNSSFKILHIEEADHINKRATTDLKTILEDYDGVVAILTTNNLDTIDGAIQSRCKVIELKQSRENMAELAERILTVEGVEYDSKQLAELLTTLPTDLRSVINELQNHYA